MNEENNKKSNILAKIRNAFILILIAFGIGVAVGYYIGYDIGFEKAARILTR